MRGIGHDLGRALLLEGLRPFAQGVGGINHVIDDKAGFAFDVADDVHHFGHVGLGAAFVDNRQLSIQCLGHGTRTHHTANVRTDHHEVFVALRLDFAQQYGGGVDVIDGNIEEALDLVGVQIDGQQAVNACGGEHIGDQFGRNRHTRRTGAAVLAGIAKEGDGSGNPTGGRTLQRVHHSQDFHQVVVCRLASRLQHEYIAATHVF